MVHAASQSAGKKSTFDALLVEVESAEDPEACCLKLQELVASVRPDAAVLRKAGDYKVQLSVWPRNMYSNVRSTEGSCRPTTT